MADEDLFLSRMRALGVEPLRPRDRDAPPALPEEEAPATVSEEEKAFFLAAMEALEVTPRKRAKPSEPSPVKSEPSPSAGAPPVEKKTPAVKKVVPKAPDPIDPVERQLFLAAVEALDAPPDKDQPSRREPQPNQVIKLKTPKRDAVKADDTLDLHGLTVDAALAQLDSFITASVTLRCRVVLVITGKGHHSKGGLAVLRDAVLTWIRREGRSRIEAYSEAPPAQGGRGAFFLYLR